MAAASVSSPSLMIALASALRWWSIPALRHPGGAGAGEAGDGAWQAEDGGQRQWQRTHQQRHPDMADQSRVAWHYIAPGKPMQKAFIESFNGRLRDELLNETLFTSLAEARIALGCWRADYNEVRPHSRLGWKTPSEFAFTCHPRRDLALRYAEGSAPAPVAPIAQPGRSNSRGELRTG